MVYRKLARDYWAFAKSAGLREVIFYQIFAGASSLSFIVGISTVFPIFAILFTNGEAMIIGKLNRWGIGPYLPQIILKHLFFTLAFVALIFIVARLLLGIKYAVYTNTLLENYVRTLRLKLTSTFFQKYGASWDHLSPSEVVYFNHQLFRFANYISSLQRANLEIFNVVFIAIFLFVFSLKISLISALVLVGAFVITHPVHSYSKKMGTAYLQFVHRIEQRIHRITHGVELLKINNSGPSEFSQLEVDNTGVIRKGNRTAAAERVISSLPDFVVMGLVFSLGFLKGNMIDMAFLISASYALLRLFNAGSNLNSLLGTALTMGSVQEEIHVFINTHRLDVPAARKGQNRVDRIESVEYRDVQLVCKGRDIIRDANFVLKRGEVVQLSGWNGSGKSSIMKAFLHLVPYEGAIIVNDALDHRSIEPESLFGRISYFSQSNFLFGESILMNLSYGNGATRGQIEALCHELGIDSFISQLNGQYDYIVSEDMKNLSGGQIQLLCLVRTFLKAADVYIFDEYANNLDETMKRSIDLYLATHFSDKILVLITHQKLPFPTKLHVVETGRIVPTQFHQDKGNYAPINSTAS